jgi:cytochrome P450
MRDSRQLAEVDTFSINSLGSRLIYTMEPENVKTIFATNFKDFGIPQTRKDALAIFGPGIFSSDGHFWEASRALLRPNFVRNQVGDMEGLEKYVSSLIEKIPRNGEVVECRTCFLI